MNNILLILKGVLIGIGKIIPGVSGSVMAISLGIYDKAIDSVTNFFDDIKNNFRFLLFLGIGIILGIIFFSKIILYFLNSYYVYTMMLFIGLIIGGIKSIYINSDRGKSGILLFILGFIFMGIISYVSGSREYIIRGNLIDNIIYFISGMLEGIGTIVPGISSTALLMIIGIYELFMESVSNILDLSYMIENINFYLSFGLGLFISIFLSIYIISYLFKRYRNKTFSFILGIILSNVLFLFINTLKFMVLKKLIIGFLLLGIGYFISLLFDV